MTTLARKAEIKNPNEEWFKQRTNICDHIVLDVTILYLICTILYTFWNSFNFLFSFFFNFLENLIKNLLFFDFRNECFFYSFYGDFVLYCKVILWNKSNVICADIAKMKNIVIRSKCYYLWNVFLLIELWTEILEKKTPFVKTINQHKPWESLVCTFCECPCYICLNISFIVT